MVVNRAGDQFLAGAALAQNQDVHVLRGQPADLLADRLHRGAAPDQPVGLVLRAVAVFEDHRHVHQAADAERLAHDLLELTGVQRLEQIVVGPELHGLNGRVGRAVSGDKDDQGPGIELVQFTEDVQSGSVAETNVKQDHIRYLVGGQVQSLARGFRAENVDALFGEYLLNAEANARLIVDYQQFCHV